MIKIIKVSKEYNLGSNSFLALNEVNLNINAGDFVSIMGSSGSGKSTLMNIIGCLDVPSSGDYELNKDNISKLTSNVFRLRLLTPTIFRDGMIDLYNSSWLLTSNKTSIPNS